MEIAYYIMYKSKEPLVIQTASDFARCCAEGKVYAYMHTETLEEREGWQVLEVYSTGKTKKVERHDTKS